MINDLEEDTIYAPVESDSYDRFDLEEQINDCWTVVEQLQLVRDATGESKDKLIDAIQVLYQHKFMKLWDTFEDLVREGKIK